MGNCFTKTYKQEIPITTDSPPRTSMPTYRPPYDVPLSSGSGWPRPPRPPRLPAFPSLDTGSMGGRRASTGQIGPILCTERATGRKYACKSVSKRKLVRRADIDDMRREITILQHLSGQPNVAEFKGAFEDAEYVHVVMELCSGGELFDRITAKGSYSERQAAAVCRDILTVVHVCHFMGVMHRDLKPENFLLASPADDAPLKAIDFGLSVFIEEGKVYKEIVGSAYYVAPEVLHRNYGKEIDVWSAGVILYILLCGSPPFWAETEKGIFDAILAGELDLVSSPWPSISEAVASHWKSS